MKMLFYIAVIFLLAMPVFGFQTEFIRQFDGADKIYGIDPVLDDAGDLRGLIYCVPAEFKIIIDMFDSPNDIHVPVTKSPVKAINAYFDPDTLYIYAAQRSFTNEYYIWLSLIKVSDGDAAVDTTVRRTINNIYGIYYYNWLENFDVKFWNDSNEVLIEACAYFEEYAMTQGLYACNGSVARSYSRDLRTITNNWTVSSLEQGNIDTDPETEISLYTDNYMYFNSYEPGETPFKICGTNITVDQFTSNTTGGNTYDIFLHDFIQSDGVDELIYYGYANDFMTTYSEPVRHIACYGFDNQVPVQYWRNNQIDSADFSYIYDNWRALVGLRNKNRIIFLDYTTGRISDSISLGKILHATRFFETGNDTPLLSLVGRSNDSIFVYYFDSPVGIDNEDIDPVVPESFQLMQNFPNPFNSTTTISYYSPSKENVTISVYNILGRKIKTIHDKAASLGLNTIDWDATDSDGQAVSSGIYFYRIEAGDYSQARKMLFLK